jgi:hypothetical protein
MTPRPSARCRTLAAALPLLLAFWRPAHAADGAPRVTACRAGGPIRVDGALDEPAWRDAGVIADLTQQSPKPGEPTLFRTEIRVLADADTIYLGFACIDPEPAKIAIHTMLRDGDMTGDDSVAVVLDTFGDRTTGYYFRLNAAGARQDGLITDPQSYSLDWDGIWDSAARRTPSGWTAEIAIPSRSLRFATGAGTWGLNVERWIPRIRTMLRWSSISLDAYLPDMRRAGELAGVGELRQGRGLSIAPYGLVRSEQDLRGGTSQVQGAAGLDVSYGLTPQLSGVVTVNTDFAETEADTRQINLTRFELFFPEKRTFFLDGSNQFEFGLGLGEQFVPFFSRRVGLYLNQKIPIDGGLKLVGRQGRWGIGVLAVRQGNTALTESTDLFVGRFTYDADEHLRLGVIATDGDPSARSSNRLAGLDAIWRTATFRHDKNLQLGAWAASSGGDVGPGKKTGWGVKVDYPNDLWDVGLALKEFGDALDPAMGFLPRPGTRWLQSYSAYQPRPQTGWWATWIRQFFFETELEYVQGLDRQTQSWTVFVAPFNVRTHSGEHLEANWSPQFEHLSEPFEVAQGVVIPAGDYHFTRYRVELNSSLHRPWQLSGRVWFGGFYDGRLDEWNTSAAYTIPSGRLQISLTAENDFGYLPQGDFALRLWQLKTVYAFTPDLVLSAYAQFDSDSSNLGVNTRLRWTIVPGTDLYVVWDHGWEHPLDEGERWTALRPIADQAIVKLRYTWRP